MPNSEDVKSRNRALIAAVRKALENGPWDKGLMFQAAGNRLRRLLARLESGLDWREKPKYASPFQRRQQKQESEGTASDVKEVFIALYNKQGENISSWQRQLILLDRQTINRSIHDSEQFARNLLQAKGLKPTDGFVSVAIEAEDILAPDPDRPAPVDRLGQARIQLKEGAVHSDHIHRFYHVSGIYEFQYGALKRVSDLKFSG